MKYFINYASNGFQKAQSEALRVAETCGFKTIGYSEKDLDSEFLERNSEIMSQKRGGGYWLWKPYIILKTLKEMQDGDYLVYMDAGAIFVRDPSNLLKFINHKGVLAFSMIQKTSKWTKGDCFYAINGDNKEMFKENNQIQATYIFFQKCDYSVKFVEKWLSYCEDKNLITDSPNINMENFPDFADHRHDQAIFSLLVYNDDIMYVPQVDQYCAEHGIDPNMWKIVERHGFRG